MFIIAGERRSGTSTLAKWIENHPEVYLYPKVDKAFFVEKELRGRMEWMDGKVDSEGWNDYSSKNEYLKIFEERPEGVIEWGEKSADYFFWEPCLDRINNYFPDAKIILTFRNPVNRAWSHYCNEFGKGRESLSFENAIKAESDRSSKSDYARHHLSYLERGKYINSLKRWHSVFSANQIHVVILEELIQNPEKVLKDIYEFMGVDSNKGLEKAGVKYNNNWTTIPYSFWTKNKGLEKVESLINRVIKKLVKSIYKEPYQRRRMSPRFEKVTRYLQSELTMNAKTRKKLEKEFEPFNQELARFLNKSLDVWK